MCTSQQRWLRQAQGRANVTETLQPHRSGPNAQMTGEVSGDLTCQAVCDLRTVFATYQKNARSAISLEQLADIIELLGDPRPCIQELTMAIGASSNDIDFKMFVRFFVSHVRGGAVG
eukprot:IDg4948t1